MQNEDFDFEEDYFVEEDTLGIRVTSGKLTLTKDDRNMVGISIGGGYPNCPCVYVVQIFDSTPASREGTLESGDEITAVNNKSVKGKTKNEVVKAIQSSPTEVHISYNKLHAEPEQGPSLDIVLKKVKHRIVEHMSSSTADSLGLSRAILCNDSLVKKLQELERNAELYRGLVAYIQSLMKHYFELFRAHKQLGDVFSEVAVRESLERANHAFNRYGETHRNMAKAGVRMLKILKPILTDLGTFLHKAIPDTELTVQKYADAKFEYLSYCLKVKEMDDEELTFNQLQESLYRVETGNYEYRLVLRCRQLARIKFSKLRSDVSVKLDLLDQKHVQDLLCQLQRLIAAVCRYNDEAASEIRQLVGLFPVEMDLKEDVFKYKQNPFESLQGNAQFEEWPLPGPGVPGLLSPAWNPQPRRPLVTPLWILPYCVPTQPAPVIYNQTFLDSNITMNFSGKKVALRASSLAAPLEKKTIAFVSGHIFCQCSVEDTKVLLPFKPLLEPQTEVAGRRISSSASDHNSFTVASTIPKLLVGNLTLLPGEELDVLYSEVIPKSNCPSFRGLAVRYSWKLAFHCQILGQATTVIHIPLWIMILPEIEKDLLSNGDGLRRTSNDHSTVDGNLPEEPILHPHNGDGEDEVFASNGPLNLQLALQSLDELTKKRNPKVFNIDCQYGKLGTLTLSKIKFRLGEEIYGKFDFSDKSVTCIQYLVSLIGDEHICEDHRKPKGIAFSENIVSKAHDFCVCLQQSNFSLPIPLHITPSFSSEIIELKWKLRFEFVLSTEAFHLDVPQVANEQQSVLWRAPVRIPVESITWNLPIDIYPTDPVQVHSVHLRDSLGGEVKVQL